VLRGSRYEPWPTEIREIELRYRDAPPAILRVPTLLSFAGWKTAAWMDRGAARDLYDLWALDKVGALNAESAAAVRHTWTDSSPPRSWMFDRAPSGAEWQAQLAGQTRLTVTPGPGVGGRASCVGSSARRGLVSRPTKPAPVAGPASSTGVRERLHVERVSTLRLGVVG